MEKKWRKKPGRSCKRERKRERERYHMVEAIKQRSN
jgi:hypothetical protein